MVSGITLYLGPFRRLVWETEVIMMPCLSTTSGVLSLSSVGAQL